MPNWCWNSLEITPLDGVTHVKKITDVISGTDEQGTYSDIMFQKILPYPDGKWDYDWCCENWGTKWDAQDTDISADGSVINFETAWSPPIPVITELARRFPDFRFELEYEEPGMGFEGTCVWESGNMILDDYRQMEWTEEEE